MTCEREPGRHAARRAFLVPLAASGAGRPFQRVRFCWGNMPYSGTMSARPAAGSHIRIIDYDPMPANIILYYQTQPAWDVCIACRRRLETFVTHRSFGLNVVERPCWLRSIRPKRATTLAPAPTIGPSATVGIALARSHTGRPGQPCTPADRRPRSGRTRATRTRPATEPPTDFRLHC
jgi:hypothetical protein